MMLAAGVDLVEVERITTAVARYGERFLTRVFTADELAYCRARPPELAARFAAKEAVSKTLGVGIQHREGVDWREIQVVSDERGKPSVRLSGKAARRAGELGLRTFALSLSHTRVYAIAMVVAE
jgi:holo-[acyl-carrier protein] synthase